jgi:hypothetical protein
VKVSFLELGAQRLTCSVQPDAHGVDGAIQDYGNLSMG